MKTFIHYLFKYSFSDAMKRDFVTSDRLFDEP